MSVPNRIFTKAYEAITTTIAYNSRWENGTGYFDDAVNGSAAPALKPQEIVKSIDPHGRRIIIIGTRLGNMVVFDRYSDWETKPVFVYNCSKELEQLRLISGRILGESSMLLVVGSWGNSKDNIGKHIEVMADILDNTDHCNCK